MNPYIIVNGQSSLQDKINTVNQIMNATARQQWQAILKANRNFISPVQKIVILNNTRASITFRFNVADNSMYDLSLSYVAPPIFKKNVFGQIPSPNTDKISFRLDSQKRKSLTLRKVKDTVSLYSNVLLSNGTHTVTVDGEPVGLISLIVKNNRTRMKYQIPAVNMLYEAQQPPVAPPVAPISFEKPVETTSTSAAPYETTTTAGPFYETTTSEGPQVVIPSYETTTSSEGPQVVISYETTSTSSQTPIVPPPILPPALEIVTSTKAAPSPLSSRPLVQEPSKKEKKGFPWWAIMLIVLAVLAVITYFILRWGKKSAASYQDQSDQQILLDFTDKSFLLQWVNNTLQNSTLQFSERKQLQTLKGALQSKSRSPEQQGLIKQMLKCRHPETFLLKWLEKRTSDPNLSQNDKKEYGTLIQALKKNPNARTEQQKNNINTLLNCKDPNTQKQQRLLMFVEKNLTKQGLSQAEKKQYNSLKQALRKVPTQRSPEQKQLVSFALNCQYQEDKIPLLSTKKTQSQVPSLTDFRFSRTRFNPDQQQSAPIASPVKTQVIPTTLRSSLTNKLLQINQKYKLDLIEPFGGQEDLRSQVFNVAQKDNVIKQYLQKFDPASKQSQEQFPNIKQRLNKIFSQKKDNILIQKILQQSLNKQKRQTETLQGAASMFAGAQKRVAQQEAQKRQLAALQGVASLFAEKQPDKKLQGGQYQRLIKQADVSQGQHMTNIRQNIKKVS